MSVDTLKTFDGPSVYGYAKQAPLELTDPDGRFVPLLAIGARIAIGAIGGAAGSVFIEYGLNRAIGMNHYNALMCIDVSQVVIGAAVGTMFPGFLGVSWNAYKVALGREPLSALVGSWGSATTGFANGMAAKANANHWIQPEYRPVGKYTGYGNQFNRPNHSLEVVRRLGF